MIIEETFKIIKAKYGQRYDSVTIEQIVAGIYFTAVKLSSGYGGLAYADLNSPECCTHSRDKGFAEFTPGNFKGRKIADLFKLSEQTGLIKTLQLAVMNAISAELMTEPGYTIIENQDPIERIELGGKKQVSMIGAFLSYIKKIAVSDCILKIIELNDAAVPEEYRQYLVTEPDIEKVISQSDIVIITGATLSNNTLDKLLEIIPGRAQVILVGPTSSLLPEVLFASGVNLIGAIRITNAEKMLELVAEGASGFHLFRYCATKICLVNES